MRILLKLFLYIIFSLIIGIALFFMWAGSGIVSKDKLSGINKYSDDFEDPSQANNRFKIMTFNCGYFSGMRNNLPVRSSRKFYMSNLNVFSDLIRNIKPDIVCFQEIDFNSHRSHQVDQSQYLSNHLKFMYNAFAINWNKKYIPFPYWPPSAHFKKMVSGQSVISMFPILNNKRIELKRPPNPFYYDKFYLDRLIQETQIRIGDKNLIILNIHLEAFDRNIREEQAEFVINYYKKIQMNRNPVIILGDFNCVPPDAMKKYDFPDEPGMDHRKESTITIFLEEESLSCASAGIKNPKSTFPSLSPDRKLDYIFYTRKYIDLVRTDVFNINSSDHLPLMMEFRMK
ncbi:MAG: endonuclease/exonuclease/phosphatase family protein [Candidatus Aminicenantes bacterium]|nr:endonuclease/exonuclease/phosphatase family protein [Candidatus Aminicenantes bacterium]